MEKVYCRNCEFCVGSENALSIKTMECYAPVDNWYSPNTPSQVPCSVKNSNNDCKDRKPKK